MSKSFGLTPKKNNDEKNKQLEITLEQELTLELVNALKRKRLLTHKAKIQKWSYHFKTLLKQYPHSHIEKVLHYYISNLGKENFPEAYSSRSFKEKFERIERLMNKDPKSVSPGPEAKEMANNLKKLWWPKGIDKYISHVIQKGLDSHYEFVSKMKQLEQKLQSKQDKIFTLDPKALQKTLNLQKSSLIDLDRTASSFQFKNKKLRSDYNQLARYLGMIKYLRECWLFQSKRFIYEWITNCNEQVQRFQMWSQDNILRMLVFNYKGAKFQELGAELIYNYCGDSSFWDKLMEMADEST